MPGGLVCSFCHTEADSRVTSCAERAFAVPGFFVDSRCIANLTLRLSYSEPADQSLTPDGMQNVCLARHLCTLGVLTAESGERKPRREREKIFFAQTMRLK